MHVEVIHQTNPVRLLVLAHLLQVVWHPGDAAMLLLIGRIVPILIGRRAPAAIHIHPGEEHPRPASGHRSGNQRGGIHGLHRRRPFDIACQHVVVAGGLRVNIDVVG